MLGIFKKKKKIDSCDSDSISVGRDPSGRITVVREGYRMFYDSVWRVITPHFVVTITRTDTETAESLLNEIAALPSHTRAAVIALDEKDRIYYD